MTLSSGVRVALVVALMLAPSPLVAASPKAGPLARVAPELQALYEAYLDAQKSGTPLAATDPSIRIADGRVTIDAVAASDVADLRADLVGLGLQHAATAGRIVSGQLPIAAIAAMAALPSLRFARAARAVTHGSPSAGAR